MRILRLACIVLVVGLTPAAHGQTPLATGREQFEAGDLTAASATLSPIANTDGSAALLLSRIAHRGGKADEAVKWGEKATALMPDSASAQVWLGRAYLLKLEHAPFFKQLGLSKQARSAYDRALALDPRSFDVRDARARYFMNAPSIGGGSIEKARQEADSARSIDPYRGTLLRGEVEERAKQPAVAESEYAAMVRAYPDSSGPFNHLVNVHQASGRYAEAFVLIDARAARLPDDESALYQAGKIAAVSGQRLEDGEAALRKYITLGTFRLTTEAYARYRLGMILEKRNELAGAIGEYESAGRLDPKLEDARKALKRLQSR
jgi:tetratricopeptide (TPR) repeat protein